MSSFSREYNHITKWCGVNGHHYVDDIVNGIAHFLAQELPYLSDRPDSTVLDIAESFLFNYLKYRFCNETLSDRDLMIIASMFDDLKQYSNSIIEKAEGYQK